MNNSTRARLGWTFSYIYCIFVHPDLDLALLFVGMRERSIKVSVKENEVPTEKILVVRIFSLQMQVIYQIKAKRSNYLIKDFISSNFKRRLS